MAKWRARKIIPAAAKLTSMLAPWLTSGRCHKRPLMKELENVITFFFFFIGKKNKTKKIGLMDDFPKNLLATFTCLHMAREHSWMVLMWAITNSDVSFTHTQTYNRSHTDAHTSSQCMCKTKLQVSTFWSCK